MNPSIPAGHLLSARGGKLDACALADESRYCNGVSSGKSKAMNSLPCRRQLFFNFSGFPIKLAGLPAALIDAVS